MCPSIVAELDFTTEATEFNCATFTASVSAEPAARLVICLVAVDEPTETAANLPLTVSFTAFF